MNEACCIYTKLGGIEQMGLTNTNTGMSSHTHSNDIYNKYISIYSLWAKVCVHVFGSANPFSQMNHFIKQIFNGQVIIMLENLYIET